MRKQNIENAVYDVATQVRSVEDCIDAALAEIADVQGRMIHACSVAGMTIGNSHEATSPASLRANAILSSPSITLSMPLARAATRLIACTASSATPTPRCPRRPIG